MPQEPKKRHSRQRKGKRRASIHLKTSKTVLCPNCQTPILPHTICKHCGYYKGKEVIKIVTKEEKEKIKAAKSEQESK